MTSRALLLITAAVLMPIPLQAQTVEERARAAAAASRAKTSDSDAIQQNYLTPGLAGEAISTIDNSKTFKPDIACQKTATLLEMIAQPASTGDIGTLKISRDKDLDGTVDQTLNLPVAVSGVCANGVISCEPGTWDVCKTFKWDVGIAGDLKLSEVALTDLAACYCVNNSCGGSLVWNNMASILKDLGGGVIGALTTADSRIGVAQAVIDGPTIRYTGAQSTACSSDPSLSQTAYRSNPTAMQSDASAAAASSSVFQALEASSAGAGQVVQMRSCTISRQVSLGAVEAHDIIARTSGGYATYDYGNGSLAFVLGSPTDNSLSGSCTFHDFRMTLHVDDPDRVRDVRLVRWFADDWGQVRIDGELVSSGPSTWAGTGLPPGKCERKDTFYAYPNIDLKPWLTKGDHEIWLRVAVSGGGEGYAMVQASVDLSCNPAERLVDLCAGNAADGKCQLYDEAVDGVDTIISGVGTGLSPLAQTRLFENGACSLSLTRPWFERSRRYRCTVDNGAVTEPDLSRGAYILDHSTETLLADRVKNEDGSYTTSSQAFALPDRGSVASCEAICKTRAPKANSDVALDGVVGEKQNDPVGYDTFYHVCTADSAGASQCPLGDGEELVSGCGCLDDFPEAVVMMQTVRLGGADLVCTGEVR